MYKHLLLGALCLSIATNAQAQRPRFGIKAGLNVSTMAGTAETNASGKALDYYSPKTGFQVGVTAALPFSDVFGAEAELLYTQRGGVYTYENDSKDGQSPARPNGGFYTLANKVGGQTLIYGDLHVKMQTSNSYVELPLLLYVKPVKQLKVSLGVSPMLLTDSKGQGEFLLKNRSFVAGNGIPRTLDDNDMSIGLNYDYIKDQALQTPSTLTSQITGKPIIIEGDQYAYPSQIGAYYFNKEKPSGENMYKLFDLGANLGVAYTFSSGLSFNLRGTYGLLDATNNRYDRKWAVNSGAPSYDVVQFDRDIRNVNVALTVGFSF